MDKGQQGQGQGGLPRSADELFDRFRSEPAGNVLSNLVTDLAKLGHKKLGEQVYKNVAAKTKKHAILHQHFLDLHQTVFGTVNFYENMSDAEANEMAEQSKLQIERNERYINDVAFVAHGLLWETKIRNGFTKQNRYITLSIDAVDMLNEVNVNMEVMDQIHKDVPRTFPSIKYFSNPEVQLSIRKILVAFSNYFPELSYVQGMNLIVSFLFLHFKQEHKVLEVFVNLTLSRRTNLQGIFKENLPNLVSFTAILEKMIQSGDNELYLHLESLNLSKFMFAYQWILSLFTYSMPFDVVAEVWTRFFDQGWQVMFKCFLVLMISNRKEILKSDFEQAFRILRDAPCSSKLPKNFIDKVDKLKLKPEHKRMIDDVVLNEVEIS